jgi:hypothetical protein
VALPAPEAEDAEPEAEPLPAAEPEADAEPLLLPDAAEAADDLPLEPDEEALPEPLAALPAEPLAELLPAEPLAELLALLALPPAAAAADDGLKAPKNDDFTESNTSPMFLDSAVSSQQQHRREDNQTEGKASRQAEGTCERSRENHGRERGIKSGQPICLRHAPDTPLEEHAPRQMRA